MKTSILPLIQFKQHGFSLVEMAVVLVILGFVIGALLLPLQAQREGVFQAQTENRLEIARKALLGFAQTNGRLPCPATVNGMESPLNGSTSTIACSKMVGYLPAVTLGLQPTDENGFSLDGWNNPIRYAVTQTDADSAGGADFTTSNEMNKVTISALTPNLWVCDNSTACSSTPPFYLTNIAAAVIYSTGKNGPTAVGIDESANLDTDNIFYSRTPTASGATGGEFDDLMVWISPYVLYNAMIEAGQLH